VRFRVAVALWILLSADSGARAGTQLFEGSWRVKAFGNERTGGTGASSRYSAVGLPQVAQCNPNQPRCPFESTPTDGSGHFDPFGGSLGHALFCTPWYDFGGMGTTVRPPNGMTRVTSGPYSRSPIPPLYRNPAFFTPSGQPNATACAATSTDGAGGKGLVQAGHPVEGLWVAATNGTQKGGFTFQRAWGSHAGGIRTTGVVGERQAVGSKVYSYVYATLFNGTGFFGPGFGLGSFSIPYTDAGKPVARVAVKQGAAKFGGVMRMLGALTSKACFYRDGKCSITEQDWRYDAIGTTGSYTVGGVIVKGYLAWGGSTYCQIWSPDRLCRIQLGRRFGWTTGSVAVTAAGSGSHQTVHYAHGYDNRNTTTPSGRGTIQLVSPSVTNWVDTSPVDYWTAGIAILRIKFLPEPRACVMLIAGIAALAVAARLRRSRVSG